MGQLIPLLSAMIRKLSLLCLLLVSGCDNSDGLKNYWLNLVKPCGVAIKNIDCSMIGAGTSRTRAGFCQFRLTGEEVRQIVTHLKLQPTTESQMMYTSRQGCLAQTDFNSLQSVESKIFIAGERLPALPGNADSSFHALFWNQNNNQACVDLYFPYG